MYVGLAKYLGSVAAELTGKLGIAYGTRSLVYAQRVLASPGLYIAIY